VGNWVQIAATFFRNQGSLMSMPNEHLPDHPMLTLVELKQKLERNERLFELLVESVQDYAIFVLSTSGEILTWNSGAARIKGYRSEEIIGQNFEIFYTQEARAAGHPMSELKMAAKDGHYEEEGWRLRKDGSLFWASVTITAMWEGNRIIGYAKVTRDLTRRKQEELERLAAAKSEQIYALLVNSVKDYAMFVLDPEGRVMTWNEGARRAKGYADNEIIGKHFSIFYSQEARDARHPEHELELAIENGSYEEEGWRWRKDGSKFWANVLITPLYLDQTLVGFAKVTRDLTEREAARQQKVEAITKTNDELQRLAYILSHELQAPISTISRYSNLLSVRYKDRLGDDADDFLAKIGEASNLTARMIDDLWNYARVSRQTEHNDVIYMGNALNTALDELLQNKVSITVTHDQLPSIRGNKMQIGFVVKELLANAYRYKSDEPAQVHVSSTQSKDRWIVAFKDNGIGIDPIFSQDVFKIFHRLSGGMSPEATGMGLAVCKTIIEQHGGDIWFEPNANGAGSTFFLSLPS
jgi:PAS domain S-box-containing protein